MEYKNSRLVTRYMPVVAMALGVLVVFLCREELTLENLLQASPASPWRAAFFLLALYAVKGLSLVLPLKMFYVLGGLLFPVLPALALNLAGMCIALTLPYLVGRAGGADMVQHLTQRYPRLKSVASAQRQAPWPLSMGLRAVGVLPCDVVSLYLGALRLPFIPYLLGAFPGMVPALVLFTLLGAGVVQLNDGRFALLTVAGVAFMAVVWLLCHHLTTKKSQSDPATP